MRRIGETAFPICCQKRYLGNGMPSISVTRLRIRSLRFLPQFGLRTMRSIAQVRKAPGFQGGALLPDRDWAFWTLTAWDSHEAMRQYMLAGDHKQAMPHLLNWCDEASVAHWEQDAEALPSWTEADHRMRTIGRNSKVLHPSPNHAAMTYRMPRTTGGGPITKAKAKAS